MAHEQLHLSHRSGWLRAGVLGANDGIISTASLLIGVAAANASKETLIVTGVIAVCSGAFSMAAGEYVSVSSQLDLENADLKIEQTSILENFEGETKELANIYQQRGLSAELSQQVASELMAHDPMAAHARDDIGIALTNRANPMIAALSSALAFVIGGLLPILIVALVSTHLMATISISSIFCLISLGAVSAKLGNASITKASARITFWGVLAMLVSAVVGNYFGSFL